MFESEEVRSVPPELLWRVTKVTAEVGVRGWTAGPVKVVTCHQVNKVSKPCWAKLTRGELRCPHCAENKAWRQIGYLPLWERSSLSRLVVIVSKTMVPTVKDLPFKTAVMCMMPKVRGHPMKVTPEGEVSSRPAQLRALDQEQPQVIDRYLLHLWGVAEINAHFGL